MFATVFSEVDVSAGAAQELVAENAAIMNATVENFMLEVERIIKNEAWSVNLGGGQRDSRTGQRRVDLYVGLLVT